MKKWAIIAAVGLVAAAGLCLALWRSPAVVVAGTSAPPAVDIPGLEAKASQGDVQAQARLGKLFAEGQGTKRDYKQAAKWLGLAATNGDIESQTTLGELYLAGQGAPNDLTNGIQWLTRAADAGGTGAQYDLACAYDTGQGAPKNDATAAKWFRLAAEGGEPLAQYDYGQRCLAGLSVPKDPIEGLKWLLIAAAQGQADSISRSEAVESSLTAAQIAEAKKRAAAFAPRKRS